MRAKVVSQLSFNAIGDALGVTNVYAAQLFHNQAQLKPHTANKLKTLFASHPQLLSHDDLGLMQEAPMRSWDDDIAKEPNIYRTIEACQHAGESLKMVVNEKFGDGIMSAIDFYVTVEKVIGAYGEPRVLLTFNGKFLPHVKQFTSVADKITRPGEASSFPSPPPLPPVAPLSLLSKPLSAYKCPAAILPLRGAEKREFVAHLHMLKAEAGLTFDQLAQQLGVTNIFAAQLLQNQAQLTPELAAALEKALPGLTSEHTAIMMLPPLRSWDEDLMKEPLIYRTLEACRHHGLAIKALINEMFGDGIMSGIDFFMSVRRAKGPHGEPRVVIVFNGKFLPHTEHVAQDLQAMNYE